MHYIYTLVDPRTSETRYVGRTIQKPQKRLRSHITHAKNDPIAPKLMREWITELREQGYTPVIVVMQAGTKQTLLRLI